MPPRLLPLLQQGPQSAATTPRHCNACCNNAPLLQQGPYPEGLSALLSLSAGLFVILLRSALAHVADELLACPCAATEVQQRRNRGDLCSDLGRHPALQQTCKCNRGATEAQQRCNRVVTEVQQRSHLCCSSELLECLRSADDVAAAEAWGSC